MARVLVLGATGMLGHKAFQVLSARGHETWTLMRERRDSPRWRKIPFLQNEHVIDSVDVTDSASLQSMLSELRPDVMVNCVGIIKQRADALSAIPSIRINALLPHQLAEAARAWGGRVIHISSDCVFSGRRGDYTEADGSDADDLYGRSKYLGEIASGDVLTLRTSIIGRELHHHESLLDWFLQQNHKQVKGYRRAWWSGVTTNHLSEVIARVIEDHRTLRGLYQVSSGKLSKHDLLHAIRDALNLNIEIVPDDEVFCDRSLEGDRLRDAIGYTPPSWSEMLEQLAADPTPYRDWVEFPK